MSTDLYQEVIAIASNEPFSLAPNSSVFFSGPKSRREAVSFCKRQANGLQHQTILTIPPWRALDQEGLLTAPSPLNHEQITTARRIICRRFCEASAGNVTVFSRSPSDRIPHGTFFDFELSLLLKNSSVSTINLMPKREFTALFGRSDLLQVFQQPAPGLHLNF